MSDGPSWAEILDNIQHSHDRIVRVNDDLIERVVLTREVIAVSRALMRQADGLIANGYRMGVQTEPREGPIVYPGDWPSGASSL